MSCHPTARDVVAPKLGEAIEDKRLKKKKQKNKEQKEKQNNHREYKSEIQTIPES